MRTEVADLEAEKIQRMEALAGINNKLGPLFPRKRKPKELSES
jgi:hypothetical protein